MACLPWILGTLVFSVVEGDEITDFLENKEELKPQRYNGNIGSDWNIIIKRDPKTFKLSSNPNDEGDDETSLGLPVSQDVIFSRRRSVVDNILSRNDVDDVSDQIEPADVSPTYSKVEGNTAGQIVYFVVIYALCSLLISIIALARFLVVRSVRHSRKKPTETEEELEEGAGTEMEIVEGAEIAPCEGAEIAPCEEQPGPSNVAIEIDSPSTTESENTEDDTNSSSSSSSAPYQTVTILGETEL